MAAPLFPLLCTQTDMEDFASVQGITLRADDPMSGALDATGIRRIQHALVMGTSTCLYYLYAKYDPANLNYSTSPSLYGAALVNLWATHFSCYWMCQTRFNEVPDSLFAVCQEDEEKLKDIYAGRHFLPLVPLRRNQAPVWDNTRLDARFNFRVIRVEKSRSSNQPTNIPLSTDYTDYYIGSFEL
jgi:hypothetical protein